MLAAVMGAALCLNAQAPPDFTPPTPLFAAVIQNDVAAVKRLLAEGANPNEGKLVRFSAAFIAVFNQNAEIFRELVKGGADVKVTDHGGSTLLMWAAYNDGGNTDLVSELLRLGLDPNQKNAAGETALTWAMRRGHTPVVEALKKAGADDSAMIRESVEKALAILQKSGPQFTKVSGCASCHQQSLPQMAVGLGRERGFAVDEQISDQQKKAVMAMYRPLREPMLSGKIMLPNTPITVSYGLLGLAAESYKADETTSAMAQVIASQQRPDGSFRVLGIRPPLEASDITATALSVRALQFYSDSPEQFVTKARQWLLSVEPKSAEEKAMKLLGLTWAKARSEELRQAANSILAAQLPDGGWAQLPGLSTDAYATGQALAALNMSGQVAASDSAYQRGITYLLRTQMADGSWRVQTRSAPIQQYKESGFPHGKDQWISAAGTSWAAMALTLTAPSADTQVSRVF
jgi:hypothetical protein